MSERVASNIFNCPNRKLSKNFDNTGAYVGLATGTYAVGTDDPNTLAAAQKGLGHPKELAMGITSIDCNVTLETDTGGDITFWTWSTGLQKWVKAGSSTARSKITFDANSRDGILLEAGSYFFLQGSIALQNVILNGRDFEITAGVKGAFYGT